MVARASAFLVLVACWTSTPVAEKTAPSTPSQRRGVIRIDAAPTAKKFQGVWLELADGKRWVIDYRPRTPWTWFRDAEVIVTGECYEPFGQAIGANHFRVDQLRFATPPARGAQPYLALGPERKLRGKFAEQAYPAGSKRAGSSEKTFVEDGGASYIVLGVEDDWPQPGTAARVFAREVEPDMAYAAQTGGPKVWIFEVREHDSEDDPQHAPRVVPCPD